MLTETGLPFTSKYFNDRFQKTIENIPELEGCSVHGLRATAVIRLKREGLADGMISGIVGTSLVMACATRASRKIG